MVFCAAGLLACAHASSTPPPLRWEYGFNNENCEAHPHKVVQTSDGGFFMVGDSVCWDGSAPADRMIFVVKTSADGKLEWSSRHGDVHYNYGKGGIELHDGTFVVVGSMSAQKTSADGNPTFVEQRAIIRLGSDGSTLQTTLLDNSGAEDGLLDGFMCVDEHADGELVLTGYKGSQEQFPDNPMFLIYGGEAFLMKLQLGNIGDEPSVKYEVPLKGADFDAVQGMRVDVDEVNGRIGVASLAVPHDDPDVPQMSIFAFDAASGEQVFGTFLPAQNELETGVMSHPYAFAAAKDGSGYVVAGHAFPCFEEKTCQPGGRLAKVSADGDLVWDTRFKQEGKDYNTECYGVTATQDGGFAVACGTGVEPEDHPLDPAEDKIWEGLVFKANADGSKQWQYLYTNHTLAGAAEDIFATKDGGFALALDSSDLGRPGTGGNFGLARIEPESVASGAVIV